MALEGEDIEEDLAADDADIEAFEEDAEDEEAEGEGKKKRRFALKLPNLKKLNKFVLIGAAAGVLLVGGALAYFLLFAGGGGSTPDAPVVEPAYFYDLPPMTVNLAQEDDEELFLKLNISLELPDEATISAVEPKLPRVLDTFQVYLRELRKSDLEGSAGIYQLKEELRRRVNLAIYPAEIKSILFREFLVQ